MNSTAQSGSNTQSLALMQAVYVLSGLATFYASLKIFTPDQMGILASALVVLRFTVPLASFGVDRALPQIMARTTERRGEVMAQSLMAWAIGGVLIMMVFGVAPSVLSWTGEQRIVTWVVGLVCLVRSATRIMEGSGLGMGISHTQVRGLLAGRLVVLVASVALALSPLGLVGFVLGQLVGESVSAVMLGWQVFRRCDGWRAPTPAAFRRLVKTTAPFAMQSWWSDVYLGSDMLIVERYRTRSEVGFYRVGQVILDNLSLVGVVINRALFPLLSTLKDEREEATRRLRFNLRILGAFSLPVAVGGALLAEPLVLFLSGPAYLPAAMVTALLLCIFPIRMVNNTLGVGMTAMDYQRQRAALATAAGIFNVLANLWAVYAYGILGAAVTTLLTEVLLFFGFRYYCRSLFGPLHVLRTLAPAIVSATLMGAAVWVSPADWGLWGRVAVGVLAYAPCAWWTGAIRGGDLRSLRSV